ncbi:hypothetical protein HN51_018047 [Arachis hypogaea]|uniref:Alpha/beta hydrolase fold-3 domain-containing protein n=2 Tax=Arachis TaxID=3817 RepID=A0A445BS22_ARAHY|nr:probable carboxylesterase 2 [Arachis duranensis]XP_025612576.1 probable carboxylesterase 2 [Arachis hypogaea]QHO29617.1 putative carboxylesterase [Arachis hypogaea]RYR41484.1 hypothetical protein Ahy_A08g037886 [Arachis hypogaea]
MDSPSNPEISMEVPPYLRIHSDGTVERLAGTQVAPPGLDPETNVLSKDILIQPQTSVTARLYRPNNTNHNHTKLPLLIYFHGGAFCISSPADPLYHNSLNRLVSEANVVALSVNYRLAPEHPLPAAYHDSWDAIQWAASHSFEGHETWLKESVDFDRVFLAGDSAGANIAHFMAIKLHHSSGSSNMKFFKIPGLIMIHPYFWGKEPIGVEATDPERKKMVDKWWELVCPSEKGNDDPLINPFVEEAPGFESVVCNNVLVIVAERDILKERGKLYHKTLVNNDAWKGKAELYEAEGEDHDFHIFNPDSDNAKSLLKRIAAFINNQD